MTTGCFERIRVQGFRRLCDVDLNLKPLNVLIGANGCGKTSLLDVFTLLADSASGKLKESLSDFGGLDANLTAVLGTPGGKADVLRFEVESPVPRPQGQKISFRKRRLMRYTISVKVSGASYQIVDESLCRTEAPAHSEILELIRSQHGDVRYYVDPRKKLVPPQWDYVPLESALSQVPKSSQESEDFRRRLATSTHYHVLDVSTRAPVRLPQPMREAKLPGSQGEDIVSCLYWMREAEPDRFEAVEDTLRAGFPNFERLNFPPVAAGTLAMTWKESTSSHPFYMHQLSEGTLRFLWLVTLLQSPGLTAVTLIDEPEVSLHPELLSLLAEVLREASQRTQLIVATHADRLVRFLEPSEVVALDIDEDGAATATRADEFDLEEWLKDYTLDEVWRMGRIGGRL